MELKSNLQEIFSSEHPNAFRQTAARVNSGAGAVSVYPWAERLNQAFDRKGWSKRKLADTAKVNYDVVNKCLRGEVENPRGEVIPRLAKALEVSDIWLRTGVQPSENSPQPTQPVSDESVRKEDERGSDLPGRPGGRFMTSLKDLPVLGYAKGGADAFFIDLGGPMVRTYRPHLLEDVPDAYAVEMWDTSMEPSLRHGWMLWVHPRKPVKADDAAVIQFTDGQALVKEYVRRTEKEWVFRQYNPAKELRYPREKVKSVHLIVGNSRGML